MAENQEVLPNSKHNACKEILYVIKSKEFPSLNYMCY